MPGKLTTLQDSIAAALSATPEIAATGIAIITSKNGSLQSQLDEALAGINAGLIVYPPAASIQRPNQVGPYLDSVAITLRITTWPENFASTSSDIAELALRRLHHARVTVADGHEVQLIAQVGEVIIPIDHPSYDIVDVLLSTQFGLDQY